MRSYITSEDCLLSLATHCDLLPVTAAGESDSHPLAVLANPIVGDAVLLGQLPDWGLPDFSRQGLAIPDAALNCRRLGLAVSGWSDRNGLSPGFLADGHGLFDPAGSGEAEQSLSILFVICD